MLDVEKLFEIVVKEKGIELTTIQKKKIIVACERAIRENDDDNSRQIAGKIYLNLILDFPDLNL
ncbi:hypothetical protein CW751_08085 [Brumimicrobium salinarum]|uniref:Uncharacterized protein n=1 Tax=Brumimicrobium salinarum TaxID=2058658 RepID=A0A2I0R2U9_9FLAO|nr:hypothetical protein [Brumimicrobium salinarum]PKR80720.1 hypothetical protein CW751_08085 [Brumimicrobium salinarum]